MTSEVQPAVAKRAADYTHRRLADMLRDVERYVSIESGSGDTEGIAAVGRVFASSLAPLGFTMTELDAGSARHVVLRRDGDQRSILAVLHLDTVWPRGTRETFPFRIEGDRVSGPGVADMKGGWVVLSYALRALDALGIASPAIEIFMTADEEMGSPSARPHLERLAREADCALVFEPARESGAIVTARGAVGALRLETFGRTAHSITGRRGSSAIVAMADRIIELEGLTDRGRGLVVNVGLVGGGSARQVVPDYAWASVDLRAPSTPLAEEAVAAMHSIAEQADAAGTRAKLSGGVTRPAFQRTAATAALFELARGCAASIDLDLREETTGAGSDGNFTSAVGTPTLDGLGPHGFNVCSRDEYILASSLPQRAALVAALLATIPTRRELSS